MSDETHDLSPDEKFSLMDSRRRLQELINALDETIADGEMKPKQAAIIAANILIVLLSLDGLKNVITNIVKQHTSE